MSGGTYNSNSLHVERRKGVYLAQKTKTPKKKKAQRGNKRELPNGCALLNLQEVKGEGFDKKESPRSK